MDKQTFCQSVLRILIVKIRIRIQLFVKITILIRILTLTNHIWIRIFQKSRSGSNGSINHYPQSTIRIRHFEKSHWSGLCLGKSHLDPDIPESRSGSKDLKNHNQQSGFATLFVCIQHFYSCIQAGLLKINCAIYVHIKSKCISSIHLYYIYLIIQVFIHLFIYLSIYISIHSLIIPSIYPIIQSFILSFSCSSIHIFIHPSINPIINPYIFPLIHLFHHPSIHLAIRPFIHPFIHSYILLFIYPSI